MKLVKALKTLGMARTGSEANRMVKEGSILVGGCIPPCNARMPPYKCVCDGWRKATNPVEEIPAGTVLRVRDGRWRLLTGDVPNKFDQVPGIGWVPEENLEEIQMNKDQESVVTLVVAFLIVAFLVWVFFGYK